MRAQVFALITAMAWGIGGYYEKRGLYLGHLTPQVGITIRTAVALIILSVASFPQWKMIPQAGSRSLLNIIIGGGIIAGAVGMLCFYMAIKGAPLNRVMPIAFTAPLFGVFMGVAVGGESLSAKTVIGAILTILGIVILMI